MKYFLSAGEASGDLHGSRLITRLRESDPTASFTLLGGDLMSRAAGVKPVLHCRDMAFMGFSEVLRNVRRIFGNLDTARRVLAAERPDALILIDYPDFNFKLGATAMKLGIPVYYYIPPKVWAWKEWRIKTLKRMCRRVFCIFPFEVDFYRRHGMDVTYVGNPSVEEINARLASLESIGEFARIHDLTSRPILALVPGSRLGEIRNNLPVMASVARHHRELQGVIAGAPGIPGEFYHQYSTLPVLTDATRGLMAHASAALVTSGTATLECALAGTPQVVCYRANGSRLSYGIMRRLLHVDYVSLPNLITGRGIIPEMLLHRCNPANVDNELCRILPGGEQRQRQIDGYRDMRERLGNNDAAATAAAILFKDLKNFK